MHKKSLLKEWLSEGFKKCWEKLLEVSIHYIFWAIIFKWNLNLILGLVRSKFMHCKTLIFICQLLFYQVAKWLFIKKSLSKWVIMMRDIAQQTYINIGTLKSTKSYPRASIKTLEFVRLNKFCKRNTKNYIISWFIDV